VSANTTVALEIVEGFDTVGSWGLPAVGVNLDVGHMYLPPNRSLLRRVGGIGALIRAIGPQLRHLHLHDVDGERDHLELGTGGVDFAEIIGALGEMNRELTATMEMQPDWVSPLGMRRGLAVLRRLLAAGGDTTRVVSPE
jgi:sugar phosphate isomerase/epimerase